MTTTDNRDMQEFLTDEFARLVPQVLELDAGAADELVQLASICQTRNRMWAKKSN